MPLASANVTVTSLMATEVVFDMRHLLHFCEFVYESTNAPRMEVLTESNTGRI